jgi:hypothetical protein
MARGKASGYSLSNKDASVVLGMAARGDRDHDIAAWFGVNQGRIAEVKSGSHGAVGQAPANDLPPKGPPGVKGRLLRSGVKKTIDLLEAGGTSADALKALQDALKKYEAHEA